MILLMIYVGVQNGEYVVIHFGEQVHVLNTDTFTVSQTIANVLDFDWSPDGKHLAFVTPNWLLLYPTDNLEFPIALTDPEGELSNLYWSPNSQKIAVFR